MTNLHAPPNEAQEIFHLYQQAQIDYSLHFLRLYITYNAWYRRVTQTSTDRQAIALLKKRFIIWDDYRQGATLQALTPYMRRLTELTHQKPFPSITLYWDGELQDAHDWRSLIEFWYQVRCLIVHGSEVSTKYAWFAYETLNVFMAEIIERMQACFNSDDFHKLEELSSLADADPERSYRFRKLQHKLYQKYIASPDIWQVDMHRVENST